jgi:hypothetical protein
LAFGAGAWQLVRRELNEGSGRRVEDGETVVIVGQLGEAGVGAALDDPQPTTFPCLENLEPLTDRPAATAGGPQPARRADVPSGRRSGCTSTRSE